jgi:hypothetical protein
MSKDNSRFRLLALAVLAFTNIVFLEHASRMEVPFAAFFLTASVWTIVIALLARPEAVRNRALLCSSIFFGLAVIETFSYFVARSQIIITKTTPAIWRRDARDIGSMPVPNSETEFREFLDGWLIVDVTYSIDANGLREIPAVVQGRPYRVAFFGCSFMFGHGVDNDQTLPYYFVQDSGGAFEGFNFAGEGWGPHQMLREIETGFVRRVAGAPDLAIYEVIPDHLRRVAGRAPWEDGPKYELCPDDEACYSGPFHSIYYNLFRRWFNQSWTVKFVDNHFARLSRSSDIPLFLAVLRRTRSLLEKSGTRFIIVLWDRNELARTMMKTLRANRFDVIAISSVVPEGARKGHPLTQLDRHPSPETNKAIAMYLWKNVGTPSLVQ